MLNVAMVLGLLTLVTFVAVVARRARLPYPTLMVLGGLAIAAVPGLPHVALDPDVVLLVFLPPLLYSAAWYTSWRDFYGNLRPIGLLAIGLVLATTVAVAVVAHEVIDGLPWAAAFALGAIVSPPDAVAATAVVRGLNVPRRVVTVLEGESLINDATGLVAYRVAVAAALTGAFSLGGAVLQFVLAASGGVAIGLGVGWLLARVHRRFDDPTVETTLTLLTPYAAYLPAEALHVSGVLATVTAGLYLSRQAPLIFSPSLRLQATAVWDTVVFLLNGVMFVLIGLQLPGILEGVAAEPLGDVIGAAVLVCLAVILVRLVWIYPAAWLPRALSRRLRERDPMPPLGTLTVLGWAGMRGVVSLAAALALPLACADGTPFPKRDLLLFLAFCVIFSTLVVQSLTLPWLIRKLGVTGDGAAHAEEETRARQEALAAALAYLEDSGEWTEEEAEDLEHLRLHFRRQSAEARARLESARSGDGSPVAVCRHLYAEALAAQRRRLLALRDGSGLHEEILNQILYDLDLEEARLRPYPTPQATTTPRVLLE
jgi:Na+/H+ antiporter